MLAPAVVTEAFEILASEEKSIENDRLRKEQEELRKQAKRGSVRK